jgi:hypothetical protein
MTVLTFCRERFENESEYNAVKDSYIINNNVLEQAKESAIVMHPMPRVNEIDPEVDFDVRRAAYFRQARGGLFVSCLSAYPGARANIILGEDGPPGSDPYELECFVSVQVVRGSSHYCICLVFTCMSSMSTILRVSVVQDVSFAYLFDSLIVSCIVPHSSMAIRALKSTLLGRSSNRRFDTYLGKATTSPIRVVALT